MLSQVMCQISPTLVWNLDTAVHHYRIRYRESGTSVWSYNHNVPQSSSYSLTQLNVSTNYEWQIKALCSANNSPSSPWSNLQTFTTANFPVDCYNTPNGSIFR